MNFPLLTRSLYVVALLVVSAFLLVVSTEETAQAHGGELDDTHHALAFNEVGREQLAHWSNGGFDYSIDTSDDNGVPSGWHSNIQKAATHLKNSTFLESVDYQPSRQINHISVEDWPFVVTTAWWGDCDEPGSGDTLACSWATFAPAAIAADSAIYQGTRHHLRGSRIMLDPADVYVGDTTIINPDWIDLADGATQLERVTAHELGHVAGFYAHNSGSNDLMHEYSPAWNLSVKDQWEINRLYMHTDKAKRSCAKTFDLSKSDYKKAGGVLHPPSGVQGDLSSTPPICPSTNYDGFAYYLYLDHDSSGRDFWTWATVNSTSSFDAIRRYAQEGDNPYKVGSEFTGTRRIERDEIFQLATIFRNSIPRKYQFRIVPDCAYPTNFFFLPKQSIIREHGHDGELSSTDSDSDRGGSDCRSAVDDEKYADFYNFHLNSEAYVTINTTSVQTAVEGLKIDPVLRLRENANSQFATPLAENDDSNNTSNSQIKQKLPAGWYTAEVSSYADNDTGDYSFSIVADPYSFSNALPASMADGTSFSATLATATATDRFTFRIGDRNVVSFGSGCPTGASRGSEERAVVMPIDSTLGNNDTLSLKACSSGNVTLSSYSGQTLLRTYSLTVTATTPVATPTPIPTPAASCGVTSLGTLTGTVNRSGSWASDCASDSRTDSYARYYSFTLSEESEVTIDLSSSEDTYLFLLQGSRSGAVETQNDDIESGVDTNSRIISTLAAGSYTVEATTYNAATTGTFSLSISLAEDTTETPVVTDTCLEDLGSLTESVTKSGSWASDCASDSRTDSYARYYSFTLSEESEVTIDLSSSEDTYLFLLQGSRSGAVETQNDDIESGVDTNSRIISTLAAGSYTVEATTYNAATTGTFSLSISLAEDTTETPVVTDTCLEDLGSLTESVTKSGSWASDCASDSRTDSYARYYSFTLSEESEVTIDLSSSEDTYLFLLQGSRSGAVETQNDDIESGVDTNSRIISTLAAGSYTVEATTYNAATTGTFSLSISLAEDTTETPVVTDTCLEDLGSLTESVTKSGSWASDCASDSRTDSYARYYSFTLSEESEVTIDLSSSEDTYLFLLQGSRSGAVETQNDDIESGVDTNSRIISTLAAGSYTVEATTYNAATTGTFSLSISK